VEVRAPIECAGLIERLRELPGGPELLSAAAGRTDVELVGGAVRDMLLARTPRELDVIVDGAAQEFADRLASALHGRLTPDGDHLVVKAHERFGTASVRFEGGRIDVAARRAESYATPGALPDVRAGTPEQDLLRRDFTINAIAIALGSPRAGELRASPRALEDLAAHRLRVLHDQSFLDDPTRMLRLARYRARLGFELDEQTARLLDEAIAAEALETVSPARIGAELRLALTEPDPVAAFASLQRLGLLSALHEAIELDAPLARTALAALPPPPDGRPDVLLLASLLRPGHSFDATDYQTRLRALLDGYEFPAAERERAVRSAILAPRIAERLRQAHAPSQIYEVAHGEPLEAVALANAIAAAAGHGEAADAARRWLGALRDVTLQITGDDLLQAGIAPGPDIGRRLRQALKRKLDGDLDDTYEQQLRAALEA